MICPDKHRHGKTSTCYASHKCRCAECRESQRVRLSRYRRLNAYGRWEGMMPAEQPAARIRELRELGWSVREIGRAAGIHRDTLYRLIHGETESIYPNIFHALMSVEPNPPTVNKKGTVDATGTRRRLQALAYMGWSGPKLAARLDRAPAYVRKLTGGTDTVTRRTRDDVARLYKELWSILPPSASPEQRRSVTVTKNTALRNRWVGPFAWDDETIDDPSAKPWRPMDRHVKKGHDPQAVRNRAA